MIYNRNAKKVLEMGLSQQETRKAEEYAYVEAEKNLFIPEDSLMNDEYDEEWRDWLMVLGMSVRKWIEGVDNLLTNDGTGSQILPWCFG